MNQKIEIAIGCDSCDEEIEVIAEYEPLDDSVTFTCPECKEEGSTSNWFASFDDSESEKAENFPISEKQ